MWCCDSVLTGSAAGVCQYERKKCLFCDRHKRGRASLLSPAVGLLRFGQRVVKEGVSIVRVLLHLQLQVQRLLQAGGGTFVSRRLAVSGSQLDVHFTGREGAAVAAVQLHTLLSGTTTQTARHTHTHTRAAGDLQADADGQRS